MRLSSIAFNNLRRRKGKALLLMVGLAVGVASVVSVQSVTAALRADTERKIDQFGANILVVPRSDSLALSYGGVSVGVSTAVQEMTSEDVAAISRIQNSENISVVAPKLLDAATISGVQALLVGVDFPEELRLKRWWSYEGNSPTVSDEVMVGQDAAHRLGVSPGSSIEILRHGFRVAAVLHPTGGQEDGLIYADLSTVQRLLNKPGQVSLVEVAALCSTCPIEDIVAQIGQKIPSAKVTALSQVMKSREQTVDQIAGFSLAVSAVIMLIGGLVVLTTMISSVNERTREIGVFRAVGFRRSHIVRMVILEAAILSILSGIAGTVIGNLGSSLVSQQLAHVEVAPTWDPLIGLSAVALSLIVGMAGSIYPAIRASALDPAEALRSI